MTKADTRLARLKAHPTDLQWDELVAVMMDLNFSWVQNAGGSSHGHFYNAETKRKLGVSKPHNPSIVKRYQIKEVLKMLEDDGLI